MAWDYANFLTSFLIALKVVSLPGQSRLPHGLPHSVELCCTKTGSNDTRPQLTWSCAGELYEMQCIRYKWGVYHISKNVALAVVKQYHLEVVSSAIWIDEGEWFYTLFLSLTFQEDILLVLGLFNNHECWCKLCCYKGFIT